jgi:hypothetical protein
MVEPKIIVGVCQWDNPSDVDEAYGKGTYYRLFPECPSCFGDAESCTLCGGRGRVSQSQAEEWEKQNNHS